MLVHTHQHKIVHILLAHASSHWGQVRSTRETTCHMQAYLILDEFILAGELQESSKHVILERISMLDTLDLSGS